MNTAALRRLPLVVFAALLLAFLALVTEELLGTGRGDDDARASGPKIGDHWHAAYAIFICGDKQRPIPAFEDSQGIHTHGDGIIHMHPFNPQGEGPGASLRSFFAYGRGKLTDSELKVRGQKSYKAEEDACNGQPTGVRVLRGDSGVHPLGGGTPDSSFNDAINKCNALPPLTRTWVLVTSPKTATAYASSLGPNLDSHRP